jgi:hypothetical protein
MGARELGTLLEGGHYFEGPRWRDGRWWVSDFYRHTVFTVEPDGSVEDILTLEDDGQPSGLGWLPDGSLIGVFARMLGGEDGKTLLMCAAPDFAQEARKAAREASLFTATVPHAGRP